MMDKCDTATPITMLYIIDNPYLMCNEYIRMEYTW